MQEEATGSMKPVRVQIVADRQTEVDVIRYEDEEQVTETHPRMLGWDMVIGHDAYALPLGNEQLLVLGTLEPVDEPPPITLNHDVEIYGDLDLFASGVSSFGHLTAAGDVTGSSIIANDDLTAFGPAVFNSTIELADADSPIYDTESQASSDTASTSSTVGLSVAIQISLPLPPGTWDVWADGSVSLINAASATARVAVGIDGNDGDIHVTPPLSTTIYTACTASHKRTGLAGDRTILVSMKFRSGTSNLTSAANPQLTVFAKRTA